MMRRGCALYGMPSEIETDSSFMGLVNTINSQMLSLQSASSIFARIKDLLDTPTSKSWLAMDREQLRACGLSYSKIDTLTTLATDIEDGTLNLEALSKKSSADIYDTLIIYKGIGAWTAKGFALMQVNKEDIFLAEDLGVRDGVQVLLNLEERPSIEFCADYARQHWYPYSGTATKLLWHFKTVAKENQV